jgi:hypothetical protein
MKFLKMITLLWLIFIPSNIYAQNLDFDKDAFVIGLDMVIRFSEGSAARYPVFY